MLFSKHTADQCVYLVNHKAYNLVQDLLPDQMDNQEQIQVLIELAQAILQVDIAKVDHLGLDLGYRDFTQLVHLDKRIYCYVQNLTLQYEREEWMDYLRGITPILVDVLRQLIKRDFLPDLDSYLEPFEKETQMGHTVYRGLQWSKAKIEAQPNKVQETWLKYYGKRFDYGHYVSSSHLLKLIETHSTQVQVRQKADQMRQIEKLARNLAAHEVVFIDHTWFVERVKMGPDEIHQLLLDLINLAGLRQARHWQILDHINRRLVLLIESNKI